MVLSVRERMKESVKTSRKLKMLYNLLLSEQNKLNTNNDKNIKNEIITECSLLVST